MEIQFKKILNKAKAIENGIDPISKTFEGAIFKESSWFLALQNFSTVEVPEVEISRELAVETEVIQEPALCEVLFLGDTYDGTGDDLLHKMIQAMGLAKGAVKRLPFNENTDDRKQLIVSISKARPKIVVSLGAIVTNILLEKKEKLSGIHGQLLPLGSDGWNCLLVPLFHPEFLLINPNMKRTAWNDLQKVMEYLKKES